MEKAKRSIAFAAILLIVIAAYVLSLGAYFGEKSPVKMIRQLAYSKQDTIDCQQKLAQEEHDYLANLLNKNTSAEDCLFMGCSQFFF